MGTKMAGINQLLPFANGETPNVLPYDEWNALAARLSGFQSGIASSKQFNYILAQGGAAGYVIGQMVADYTTETATISATPLYQAFKQAMSSFVADNPILATGTTTARSAADRFADVVNVRDFGAKGDGVTDDTAAFEAAEALGRCIFVPHGTYYVTKNLSGSYIGDWANITKTPGQMGWRLSNLILGGGCTIVGMDTGNTSALESLDVANAQLTLIGRGCGRNLGSGADSTTAIGQGCISGESIDDELSDYSPYTGVDNVLIGFHAGKRVTSGSSNVGIGRDSLNCITDGTGNTAVGATSLQQLFHGSSNTCVGRRAGMRMGTTVDASGNRVSTESVSNNTFVGESAGREARTGVWNTYVGQNAGRGVTSEETPLTGTSTGQRNTVVGGDAFTSVSSGSSNTIIGQAAGGSITTGSDNVVIGKGAGVALVSSSGAVIIGSNAAASATSATNCIVIGNNAFGSVVNSDNAFVVGGNGGLAYMNGVMGGDANYLRLDASFTPSEGEKYNLGSQNYKWDTIFAATDTIITSDSRCKSSVASASDTLLDAIGAVPIHTFRFTDAVEKKGTDAARFHVGVVAQEVASAFEAKGLDAARYGLFCHDEWPDEYETVEVVDQEEVLDGEGNVVTPRVVHTEQKLITAAGDRYGIRYEELLMLECARLRRELQRVNTALINHGITLGDE